MEIKDLKESEESVGICWVLTSFKVELINLQRSPQRTCQGCYPSINETAPSMASLLLQLIQDSWQFRVDSNLKHVLQNAKCSLPLASGLLQMLKSSLHPVANLCNSGKYSIIMFESVHNSFTFWTYISLIWSFHIVLYHIPERVVQVDNLVQVHCFYHPVSKCIGSIPNTLLRKCNTQWRMQNRARKNLLGSAGLLTFSRIPWHKSQQKLSATRLRMHKQPRWKRWDSGQSLKCKCKTL